MNIESQLRKIQEEFNLLDLRLEYERFQLNLNSSQHFVAMLSNIWEPFFLKNDYDVFLCKSKSIEIKNKKYTLYIKRVMSEKHIERYTLVYSAGPRLKRIDYILDWDDYLYDLLTRNANVHYNAKDKLLGIIGEDNYEENE